MGLHMPLDQPLVIQNLLLLGRIEPHPLAATLCVAVLHGASQGEVFVQESFLNAKLGNVCEMMLAKYELLFWDLHRWDSSPSLSLFIVRQSLLQRSEERRVGKEGRSRW